MKIAPDHKDKIEKITDDFFQGLRKEKEIRFIMDHSNNYGNQASCIHLMKRIISLVDSPIPVTLVYTGGKTTEEKLHLFLKDFSSPSKPLQYGKSIIKFLEWKGNNLPIFEDECTFGFTGGFDSDRQDLTEILNVRYFLHLSLQGWFVQEKIDIKASKTLLLSGPTGIDPYLIDRAYYYEDPEISDSEWLWYEKHGSKIEKQRVCQSKLLLDIVERENFDLCPAFSIRMRGGQISIEPEEILSNLIAGILQSQNTNQNCSDKAIVLLLENERNMSKECLEKVKEFVEGTPNIKEFFQHIEKQMLKVIHTSQKDSESNNLLREDLTRRVKRIKNLYGKLPEISEFMKTLSKNGKRVHYLSGEDVNDLESLSEKIKSFQEDQDASILVFSLYNVPPEIFQVIYKRSTLPCVFEGQTTASQILNTGKPYFQLNRLALFSESELFKATRYPTRFLPDKFKKIASECRHIANYLHNAFASDNYKQSIHEISDFIEKTRQPESHLNEYFNTAKQVYGSPLNDKLLIGCMHLAKVSGITIAD
jgi:uncharacterized protein YoxC